MYVFYFYSSLYFVSSYGLDGIRQTCVRVCVEHFMKPRDLIAHNSNNRLQETFDVNIYTHKKAYQILFIYIIV